MALIVASVLALAQEQHVEAGLSGTPPEQINNVNANPEVNIDLGR